MNTLTPRSPILPAVIEGVGLIEVDILLGLWDWTINSVDRSFWGFSDVATNGSEHSILASNKRCSACKRCATVFSSTRLLSATRTPSLRASDVYSSKHPWLKWRRSKFYIIPVKTMKDVSNSSYIIYRYISSSSLKIWKNTFSYYNRDNSFFAIIFQQAD